MRDNLSKRVEQFVLMELPGQPRMMHMGTSYLVNDLHQEILNLEEQIEKAKCCGSCKWWAWAEYYDQDDYCNCKKSEYYCKPIDPDKLCDKWEVR